MKKISTNDCKLFLQTYYNEKNQSTEETDSEDWELIKKYKNYNGETCRDFINLKTKKELVLVVQEDNNMEVMEDVDYTYFFKELAKRPSYYYVPVITNDGLIFYFEKASAFNESNQLSTEPQKYKPNLVKHLTRMFPDIKMATLGVDMGVAFPGMDIDTIIKTFEKNRFSFNPALFKLLDKDVYQPFIPDINLAIYDFPKDESLTEEEAITSIFDYASNHEVLVEKDYARIKHLLRKVSIEEMKAIENIALSFRKDEDELLRKIIVSEYKRKKLPFYYV